MSLFDTIAAKERSSRPTKEPAVPLAALQPVETAEELRSQLSVVAEAQKHVTFLEVARAIGYTKKYRPHVNPIVIAAVGSDFECLVVNGHGGHHHKVAERHQESLKALGYTKFPVVTGRKTETTEEAKETL